MMRARHGATLLAAVGLAMIVSPSQAQHAGDGFLFQMPGGSWGARVGVEHAMANSDVFSFVTNQLTLDRSDFNSATLGGYLALRLSRSRDLVIDVSFSQAYQRSEFRDWVDQNDKPIEQTTDLRRIPVTAGIKQYITPRGRAVGQFAWIPASRALYIGVGGGMMNYRFRQSGDFVDFETLNVFTDTFESSAWAPVAHALTGLEFALGQTSFLSVEARYTWARGPMGSDYVGFNDIDLSGVAVAAGISLRL